MTIPGIDWFADRVDQVQLVRGASQGFTALVVGGAVAPLGERIPIVGPLWLALVALAAFTLAGRRVGDAGNPWLHGATAAAAAYLLVLPLVGWAAGIDLAQTVLTFATAIGTGAVAGGLTARLRARPGRA